MDRLTLLLGVMLCLVPTLFRCAVTPRDSGRLQDAVITVDEVTLAHVRREYPETTMADDDRRPYFRAIELVQRFSVNGELHQLLWIARGRVRHSETIILDSAGRVVCRDAGVTRGAIEIIDETWLRQGNAPLVHLGDPTHLDHVRRHGHGEILAGLVIPRVRAVLNVYLAEGRAAFLEAVPSRRFDHPWEDERIQASIALLPERLKRVEIYPSLVVDFRPSGFRYASPWEATVMARLTPLDPAHPSVMIEIGASGWSEGAHESEVECFSWSVGLEEPTDRPPPM